MRFERKASARDICAGGQVEVKASFCRNGEAAAGGANTPYGGRIFGVKMKPSNKRINKRKASKVTLKTHRKLSRNGDLHEQMRKTAEGLSSVRPEDIKMHQHY